MSINEIQQDVATAQAMHELFNPKSIALIGATDKSLWSLATFNNIRDSDFAGTVYVVNPKAATVHGENAYKSVSDLPETPDLAYIMVPTSVVLPIIKESVTSGVRNFVILTAGFGEVGPEGQILENEIIVYAREHSLRVLGPNGNGFINANSGITPYGLPINRPMVTGSVGIILQSGALASSILGMAKARNVGVGFLTAMGNESITSTTDVLEYLVDDPSIKVIAMFLESIRSPQEFSRIARRALTAGKPIVAVKIGRSELSAKAALSHTGSLVGDDRVIDTVFKQLGVIRVRSLEDLIVTAGLLAATGPLPGRRVGFVTPSGGASELIADRAQDEGLELPEFSATTIECLEEILPDFATVHNPLDVTGYVVIDRTLSSRALEIVASDPGIDFTVVMTDLPKDAPAEPELALAAYRAAVTRFNASPIPVVAMCNGMVDISEHGRATAEAVGYPHLVGGIEHGMTALGNAVRWSERYREAQCSEPHLAPSTAVVGSSYQGASGIWVEHQAAGLLTEYGIPVVPHTLSDTADDAVTAAEKYGYPVVLKAVADGLGHKSDIGGVRLGLCNADDVRRAHEEVIATLRAAGASGAKTMIQPQRSDDTELIVGVIQDPAWGPTLTVGFGGIWVEVLRDSALRCLPATKADIRQAIGELRGIDMLQGARGREPVDLDALTSVIAHIGEVAVSLGDRLESLEINPLLVSGTSIEALDALITWTA